MSTTRWGAEMDWKLLSKTEAEELSNYWEKEPDFLKIMDEWDGIYVAELSKDYKEMRDKLLKMSKLSKEKTPAGRNEKYRFDLEFGLNLYNYFNKRWEFTAEKASNDDIWRYIQMRVIPGLVWERWESSNSDSRINVERFWKNPRRIWLKSLWWYIHLSLCDDSLEKTRDILINNTSDTIVQIVERSGTGYRVDLYREIIKRLDKSKKRSDDLLRKVMSLNTARCTTMEPLLIENGLEDYVDSLFTYFEVQ